MHPNLSFDQAPPVSVPFRFFLTAPWFGVAAGLLLAWFGETAIASRWTGQALALTHLLVAGYLLQAMTGALFQFVPVAAGGNVWRPRLVAAILHSAFIIAAPLLAAGFLFGEVAWLRLAAAVFLPAILLQVAVVGTALWRTPAGGATVRTLRIAIAGLLVTVVLGATLAEGLAVDHRWPLIELTQVHAAWGLGGWALMLVMGVSYFVVPMFQLTPPYLDRLARWLPTALVVALLAWSLQLLGLDAAWITFVWLAGLGIAAGFALLTLRLQQQRRRRISDPTFHFFRGAMLCLALVWLSAAIMVAAPTLGDDPRAAWWLGIVLIPGVFISLINGMLYKIVPFLCWLHLQRLAGIGGVVPNMREIISEQAQRWQMRLHFLSVALLLSATFLPQATVLAGFAFAAASAWLGRNLLVGVGRFRSFRDRDFSAVASPVP